MRTLLIGTALALLLQGNPVDAFSTLHKHTSALKHTYTQTLKDSSVARQPLRSKVSTTTLSAASIAAISPVEPTKKERGSAVRKEGGLFAFNTKYGGLNPFAIYYGLVSILLGIPWYFALTFCQLLYKISGNRWDQKRRVPITINHIWGVLLMRLTNCYPRMENVDILRDFYKE
jgi:hypothetical protein